MQQRVVALSYTGSYCYLKCVRSVRQGDGENLYHSEDPKPTQPTHGRKEKEKLVGNKIKENIREIGMYWLCS